MIPGSPPPGIQAPPSAWSWREERCAEPVLSCRTFPVPPEGSRSGGQSFHASWRLHHYSLAPPWASPGLGAADSRVTQRPCPPGADALEKQTEIPSGSRRKSQRALVALHLLSLDQAGQQRLKREAEVFAQGSTQPASDRAVIPTFDFTRCSPLEPQFPEHPHPPGSLGPPAASQVWCPEIVHCPWFLQDGSWPWSLLCSLALGSCPEPQGEFPRDFCPHLP